MSAWQAMESEQDLSSQSDIVSKMGSFDMTTVAMETDALTTLTTTPSNYNDVTTPSSILYIIILTSTTVIGNIGNVMVIGAVLSDRRLRKECNVFILNLALADLCVTSFVDPASLAGIVVGHTWFLQHDILCHSIGSICLVSCVCSLWSIGAISVNRFVLLCRQPYYHRIFSWRSSALIALGLWCIAISLDLPNFLDWGDHTYDMKTMACSYDRLASYSYTVFFITMFVTIPLMVVLYCNINIYLFVLKSRKRVAAHAKDSSMTTGDSGSTMEDESSLAVSTVSQKVTISPPPSPSFQNNSSTTSTAPLLVASTSEPAELKVTVSKEAYKKNPVARSTHRKPNIKRELRLAKTLFIVFMVFCVSWAPYALICLIDRYDVVHKDWYSFSILMAHTSSTLNSVLYAATNKGFRDGYKMFLKTCCCFCFRQ